MLWRSPLPFLYRDRKSKLLKHCVTAFRTDTITTITSLLLHSFSVCRAQTRRVFHIVDTLPLLTTVSFEFDSLRCNHLFSNSLIPVLTPLSQALVQKATEHSLNETEKGTVVEDCSSRILNVYITQGLIRLSIFKTVLVNVTSKRQSSAINSK